MLPMKPEKHTYGNKASHCFQVSLEAAVLNNCIVFLVCTTSGVRFTCIEPKAPAQGGQTNHLFALQRITHSISQLYSLSVKMSSRSRRGTRSRRVIRETIQDQIEESGSTCSDMGDPYLPSDQQPSSDEGSERPYSPAVDEDDCDMDFEDLDAEEDDFDDDDNDAVSLVNLEEQLHRLRSTLTTGPATLGTGDKSRLLEEFNEIILHDGNVHPPEYYLDGIENTNLDDYRRKEYAAGTEREIRHAEDQWSKYVVFPMKYRRQHCLIAAGSVRKCCGNGILVQ